MKDLFKDTCVYKIKQLGATDADIQALIKGGFINYKEFLINKNSYIHDEEMRCLKDFIESIYRYGLIINFESRPVDEFQLKLSRLLDQVENLEFDCLLLASTYFRSFYNQRFFADKSHLSNIQKNNDLLEDTLISGEKAVYLLNKTAARKLLEAYDQKTGNSGKTFISDKLNSLILKDEIKCLASSNIIPHKQGDLRLDNNQHGVFSTLLFSEKCIESVIDKSSSNWVEYEGPSVIEYQSKAPSDNLFFNPKTIIPSNGLFYVKEGFVCSSGLIYSPDKKPFHEFSLSGPIHLRTQRDTHAILHQFQAAKGKIQKNIGGTCLHICSSMDHIYGHALLGTLPKAKIFKEINSILDINYDYIVLPNSFKHLNVLIKYLNLQPSKVIKIEHQHLYKFDTVIGITHRSPNRLYRKNNFDFFKESFELKTTAPFRNIYVPRVGHTRNPDNETEITGFFEKKGFEIINPDTDKRYLPQIFHEAKIIAGLHGSNLADACFSQSGGALIDILSPFHVYQYYSSLANSMDLNYYSILGSPSNWPESFDYKVNIRRIECILDILV